MKIMMKYVYIRKSEFSFWISQFGTFSIRKTILLEQKESSCGTAIRRASTTLHVQTCIGDFARSSLAFMECSARLTVQTAACMIASNPASGESRFPEVFCLLTSWVNNARSSVKFRTFFVAEGRWAVIWKTWVLQILRCHQNERHNQFLQEWTKNLQTRVSRSFNNKSVRICECEHVCSPNLSAGLLWCAASPWQVQFPGSWHSQDYFAWSRWGPSGSTDRWDNPLPSWTWE